MFDRDDAPVVKMINPKPKDIEDLCRCRLIDFNGRNYDRHILYARLMGYTNEQLYELSQKIINAPKGSYDSGKFSQAYNIGYTDIYDFAAKKQSLKIQKILDCNSWFKKNNLVIFLILKSIKLLLVIIQKPENMQPLHIKYLWVIH
jgi:hypothetical protein